MLYSYLGISFPSLLALSSHPWTKAALECILLRQSNKALLLKLAQGLTQRAHASQLVAHVPTSTSHNARLLPPAFYLGTPAQPHSIRQYAALCIATSEATQATDGPAHHLASHSHYTLDARSPTRTTMIRNAAAHRHERLEHRAHRREEVRIWSNPPLPPQSRKHSRAT